jgi:2-amino-4-hydroxy-6-hydroxymethyldihydropteridine diphosphokinase
MILVAIGANLPGHDGATPLQTCAEAVHTLAKLPGLQLQSVSRWYETEPVPRSDQPNYVNGVARLQRMPGAAISPEDLLAALQAIEVKFGRRRSEPNAARTLDLDLIDVDGLVRETPDPILPHPRTHQRAFVLLPLLDVAPDWVHPGIGRTGRALLNAVDQSGVRLLVPSPPSGNHIQVPRLQPR